MSMETINGTICISHAELTGRIITTANLNALVRKNQVKQMRKGGNGRTALYAVESLPLKWRTEVYKRYPDLQEQADSREFIDTVEPDGKALSFYQDYKLSDGRNLPDDKVLEYASNAAIMNAFRRRWEAHVSKRQRSGKRTTLAKEFDVSRQVIVQDVALLRANGKNIFSTNRGYLIQEDEETTRVFKVQHEDDEVEKELTTIVDLGGTVEDVFVYHKVYGVLRAEMNIKSRMDIRNYMEEIRSGKSSLLKNVTSGYHYHTVRAERVEILDMIQEELQKKGLLAKLQDYEPVDFWGQNNYNE